MKPIAFIEFKGQLIDARDWYESSIDIKPYVDENGKPIGEVQYFDPFKDGK